MYHPIFVLERPRPRQVGQGPPLNVNRNVSEISVARLEWVHNFHHPPSTVLIEQIHSLFPWLDHRYIREIEAGMSISVNATLWNLKPNAPLMPYLQFWYIQCTEQAKNLKPDPVT
jgi:hypothetical protein